MNDIISRQAAIDAMEESKKTYFDRRVIIGKMQDIVNNLPSAQPTIEERKTGEWTSENACEFCGFQPWFENDIHTLSFCPNCGADMKGDK